MRCLLALALPLCLLGSCASSAAGESGPEYPGDAIRWRAERWQDEHGNIPVDGWLRALRAREQLVAASSLEDDGGIAPDAWVERGPFNVSGRSRTLVIDPRDTRILWSGGVSGGLWKSLDRGATWNPVDDWWTNLSIASMTMDPANPDVMYVGTGEGFFNDNVARGVNRSAVRGAGIFKTTDGGATWTQLVATASFGYVQRVAVSPSNGNVLLAAVRPGGIQRSTDGGTTWSLVHAAFSSDQVLFDPNDGQKALAHVVDATLAIHGVVRSLDGGASWSPAASGLASISGYDARIEMCYARSVPGVVYASVGNNGGKIWRSANGGLDWVQRTGTSSSGVNWYFNGFWVDPTNENRMVVAGLHVWRSTNGGTSLARITNGYIMTVDPHLDVHAVVADPDYDGVTKKRVYVTTDGGLHAADDITTVAIGSGWRDLDNNLRSTQYYGAAGHATGNVVIGGLQDNCTQRLVGASTSSNMPFGGDGGQVQIDPTNPSYVYGEYVWLQVHRSTNGGSSSSSIYNNITEIDATTANFIAPIVLDPNSSLRLYGGATRLWRTANARAGTVSWSAIKPGVGSKISAIAVAAGNADVVWVAHNDGRVYRTANALAATPTWVAVDDNAGLDPLPNRYVTRLAIDPTNHQVVWATLGGFASGNLRVTRDGGATWSDAAGVAPRRLPDLPLNCVVLHPDDTDVVYVASELGIFASDDAGQTWSASNDGPANVATEELAFMHGNRRLIAATLGRGVWTVDVTRATSTAFGSACSGHASPPDLSIDPLATARIGRTMHWLVANAPVGGTSFLMLGFSDTVWAGGALPFDLAPVGMAGCPLLVSPDLATSATADASGTATHAVPLPDSSALLGAILYGQAIVPAPGLNALGLGVSAGVAASLGW